MQCPACQSLKSKYPRLLILVCTVVAAARVVVAQGPPAPLTLEQAYGDGTPDGFSTSNTSSRYLYLRAVGDGSHVGAHYRLLYRVRVDDWAGFSAALSSYPHYLNESFHLADQYDFSADVNSPYFASSAYPPSILEKDHFEDIVDPIYAGNNVKKKARPIAGPSSPGGAQTALWDAHYTLFSNNKKNYWDDVAIEQDRRVFDMEKFFKRAITEQTAYTSTPIDGAQFWFDVGEIAAPYMKMELQIMAALPSTPPTSGYGTDPPTADPPPFTFVGTSTPLETQILLGSGNGGRPVPYPQVPGIAPVTRFVGQQRGAPWYFLASDIHSGHEARFEVDAQSSYLLNLPIYMDTRAGAELNSYYVIAPMSLSLFDRLEMVDVLDNDGLYFGTIAAQYRNGMYITQ